MIKAAIAAARETAQPQDKLDALARALGFLFEDGEYVKSVKKRGPYKRHIVHAQVRKIPGTRKEAHRYKQFPVEFRQVIRALQVGETFEMGEFARKYNVPFKAMRQRIRNIQWEERTHNNRPNVAYDTLRSPGSIRVVRIA